VVYRWAGVNNICDLMTYIENDDIRDVGIIFTLPFYSHIYVLFRSSVVSGSYSVTVLVFLAMALLPAISVLPVQ
jgi:hypothetical protein